MQNKSANIAKYLAKDLVGEFLYWPAWWYSRGLIKTALFCLAEVAAQEERLGIRIWTKNIFVPMFGQYDWEGRIISFFMRLFQIIFRSILLIVWLVVMLAVFIIYLILPVFTVYQLIVNLF